MLGQPLRVPVALVGAVDADCAVIGHRCAGERADQGRLARTARPDDRDDLARLDCEIDVLEDRLAVLRIDVQILDLDLALRPGQLGQREFGRRLVEQFVQ